MAVVKKKKKIKIDGFAAVVVLLMSISVPRRITTTTVNGHFIPLFTRRRRPNLCRSVKAKKFV